MKHARIAAGVIVVACLVIFLLQNIQTVQVRFLFFELSMPRALLIVSVFVIGALIGWILSDLVRSRSKR